MHHVPQPKDQARILTAALQDLGLELPHQQALEVAAKMMGYKDWQTHSAALKIEQAAKPTPAVVAAPTVLPGPEDGDIYEALVTVDQTMSARIRVRAEDPEQARELLREAAAAQYPRGFEVDEGNYRGVSDYYLADPDALENLSEPVMDDGSCDHWAKATWEDADHRYEVEMSRDEPDNSDEEAQAAVSLILRLHRGGKTLEQPGTLEVHGDLRDYLQDMLDEYEFNDLFGKMRLHWLKAQYKVTR